MQAAVRAIGSEVTVLCIAHRLPSIIDYERVLVSATGRARSCEQLPSSPVGSLGWYDMGLIPFPYHGQVMDAGRAVEFDEPHGLLQRPSSLFSSLVDSTGAEAASFLRTAASAAAAARCGGPRA